MTTYKVELEGSDGKHYMITYEGLWGQLKKCMTYEEKTGWNGVTKTLRKDVTALRDLILSEILIPKAKLAMLQFLKDNPEVQTRNFYDKAWRFGEHSLAWYHAQEELEAEGKIVSKSHGRGQNRTWTIRL